MKNVKNMEKSLSSFRSIRTSEFRGRGRKVLINFKNNPKDL
jgi:hypothetical protein